MGNFRKMVPAATKKKTATRILPGSPGSSLLIPHPLILVFFVWWSYTVLNQYYRLYPLKLSRLRWTFSVSKSIAENADFLRTLGDHFLRLIFLFFFLLTCFGLGKILTKRLRLTKPNSIEELVFVLGLGLGGLTLGLYALGILGLFYKPLILVFMAIFGAVGLANLGKVYLIPEKRSFLETFLLFLLLCGALVNFVASLVPETFYDSLVYHLALPQAWIQNHKIYSLPYFHMSYYPLNIELLYTVGILLKDEILASMINFCLGILLVLLIYAFCVKYFSREIGLFSSALFYTVPLVSLIASKTAIEIGLGVYEFLAVFSIINWTQEKKREWFYLSAIFCGLALGSKYICMFSLVSLIFLIIIDTLFREKKKLGETLRIATVFGLVSFLVASPWYIKNLIYTGNPIYPFLSHKIGFLKPWNWKFGDPGPYPFSLESLVLLPWKITMGQLQESYSGPVFLLLLVLFFLKKRISGQIKLLWAYFIPYLFLWILVGRAYLRYFTQALPVLCIICAWYLLELKENALLRKGLVTLCCIAFVTNLELSLSILKFNRDPWGVALGLQTKRDYLRTQRPSYPCPYYGTIDWANHNLQENARILFVGECRGYYSKRKFITSPVGDSVPFIEYIKEAGNAEELYHKLREEGITHLLINLKEAIRLKGYNIFYWSNRDFDVFCNFWNKYIRELYGEDGVYLYEIMYPEEASKPHHSPVNFLKELQVHNFEENALLQAFAQHKKWDELEREYRLILQYMDSREGYLFYSEQLARVLIEKGNYEEAKRILEQILEIRPDREDLRQTLRGLEITLNRGGIK